MKFRKKPVVIDAVRWTGANVEQITEFIAGTKLELAQSDGSQRQCIARFDFTVKPSALVIPTLEGDHTALAGDWIIRGIKGEFYPCKPDIFEATYDAVDA